MISFHTKLYFINLLFYSISSFSTPATRLKCTGDNKCTIEGADLQFFLIGDTGGDPIYPYTSYAQRRVADAMNELNTYGNYSFVINTGDNIYFNGASHVFDTRFEDSFEYPYDKEYLKMPFYMIFGNHDYLGNIDAQINYTYHSNKWTFPSYYYKINYELVNNDDIVKIKFIMLDTMQLCGNTIDIDGDSIFSWLKAEHHDPSGPENETLANAQWDWIEGELQNSREEYLFVVGHYPVYSASEHGPTDCLIEKLDPLLRLYNVTAYFSGHDHNLQDILVHDNKTDTYMTYVVSGGGSKTDRSQKSSNKIPSNSLRFMYPVNGFNPFGQLGLSNGAFAGVKITPKQTKLTFYNGKEEELHNMYLYPRSK
uniref:Tartrate-resistant acid phosphatase type 5 n=1 Tax=Parastrongyloides trichosuri TaxID=131310 RepID=A0A0N4ZG83_PARTI